MFVIVEVWRLLNFEMVGAMVVEFGLLAVWCLEWVVVGSKQVECEVVSIVVEYWLKENVGLFVVENNGWVLRLDIYSSVVGCEGCREVKDKGGWISIN